MSTDPTTIHPSREASRVILRVYTLPVVREVPLPAPDAGTTGTW